MKICELTTQFTDLLNGFSEMQRGLTPAATADPRPENFTSRLFELLDGFESLARNDVSESAGDPNDFAELLGGFERAAALDDVQQVETAGDFNLLDVLHFSGDELRHSRALAWILDRNRLRHGTHCQGPLGFKLFLDQFGLPGWYADQKYGVRREVCGDESRIDLEIGCRSQFLIHIEVKMWAGEGHRETEREWSDLNRRARELRLPIENRVHAFYLTPSGSVAGSEFFTPISWLPVARIFEKFAELARPEDVRLFARHFARCIDRFSASEAIRE
jgi:hypothetical protein